jgi:Domain of unknown function (DUF4276)
VNEISIASIVEGHGEVAAVPILLRRIGMAIDPLRHVRALRPYRVPRGSVVKDGELERYIELAVREVGLGGAVVVGLDADKDCAARLGPAKLNRARSQRPGVAIGLCLAVVEFEAWFLAAAVSLRGQRGLPHDLEPPSNAEGIVGAKSWLQRQRTDGRSYSETIDQPALADQFDLAVARAGARSFDKFFREIERLMIETRRRAPTARAGARISDVRIRITANRSIHG